MAHYSEPIAFPYGSGLRHTPLDIPTIQFSLDLPRGMQQSTRNFSNNFRRFRCPSCDRRFNRKFTLTEHLKTHTGEKPYQCPVTSCGKCFSTSGNLSRHKRLHSSNNAFACSAPGCDREFQTQAKLKRHMQVHSGRILFFCQSVGCGKTFSSAGNLNRHMKNYHGPEYRAQQAVAQAAAALTESYSLPDLTPLPFSVMTTCSPIVSDPESDAVSQVEAIIELLDGVLEHDKVANEEHTHFANSPATVCASDLLTFTGAFNQKEMNVLDEVVKFQLEALTVDFLL